MTKRDAIGLAAAVLVASAAAACAPDYGEGLAPYDGGEPEIGSVGEDEFYGGAYDVWNAWDADRDGLISEDEFGAAPVVGFGDVEVGAFEDWDLDRSGVLDQDELTRGVADRGL